MTPEARPAQPGDAFLLDGWGFCCVTHVLGDRAVIAAQNGATGSMPRDTAGAYARAFESVQPS